MTRHISVALHISAPTDIPPEPPPDGTGSGAENRPVIAEGDYGFNVSEVQGCLGVPPDGDFGPATRDAVETYQRAYGLTADGVVGPATWKSLAEDFSLLGYPFPLPPVFSKDELERITDLAISHPIAAYSWRDRGRAPPGYVKGMAVAYAQAYVRYASNDPLSSQWAKANTHEDAYDALAWYRHEFEAIGLDNEEEGVDTLRHLYVLLMGLGMRESSGQHCCGRDQSASNTDSNTCEAGLFQTSFNASTCCTDFLNLFDQYEKDSPQGYMGIFSEGVTCSSSDWACYGTGDGYRFQELCKFNPTFAVETCGITLRCLRQHYGPINRKEAEVKREADDMFWRVQNLVDSLRAAARTGV
jgi:Putative peptidoglycan binding domain